MKGSLQIFILLFVGPLLASADLEKEAELWAATSKNMMGSVEVKADARLVAVQEAFEGVLGEMSYTKTKTKKKDAEAVLTFRGADDEKITLKLKEFPDYTNIKIRIGWTGNGGLSRKILERVYLRL
jgi:hypothetical protein